MIGKFRQIPLVCLLISVFRIFFGKLKYSKEYTGRTVKMDDGSIFTIFREIKRFPINSLDSECVFIVRFKFKHLGFKANKLASKIPMFLIAGQSGFVAKCYAVNHQNGFWQGMYQWKTMKDLDNYKHSFIYKMMNKRAIPETIQSWVFKNQKLNEFIYNRINL